LVDTEEVEGVCVPSERYKLTEHIPEPIYMTYIPLVFLWKIII